MKRAIALTAALACAAAWAEPPADAPTSSSPRTLEVARATVTAPGADAPVEVGAGCYLRQDVCVNTGRELARLRAENAALKTLPKPADESPDLAIVGAVLVVVAAGAGYAAGQLMK